MSNTIVPATPTTASSTCERPVLSSAGGHRTAAGAPCDSRMSVSLAAVGVAALAGAIGCVASKQRRSRRSEPWRIAMHLSAPKVHGCADAAHRTWISEVLRAPECTQNVGSCGPLVCQ